MPSKCRYGRKITGRRGCKSKPGPKRSRVAPRSRAPSRRRALKSRVAPRRRRCVRGVKTSPPRKGSCRRSPGPKRSRKSRVAGRQRRAHAVTNIRPNYTKYLYYLKGLNVWQVPRAGNKTGQQKVLARNVIRERNPKHLYFLKKNSRGTLSLHSRKLNNQ